MYAVADPALSNEGDDDLAAAGRADLVASDGAAALSLAADTAFDDRTVGHLGTSDARTDLLADGDLDARYGAAGPGNVVLAGTLTGVTGSTTPSRPWSRWVSAPTRPRRAPRRPRASPTGFDTVAARLRRRLAPLHPRAARRAEQRRRITDAYWASVS